MEQEITFNEIPAILGTINRRLSRIEDSIQRQQTASAPATQKKRMTLDELLDYLPVKVKRDTIYKWRYQGRIPYHRQNGNLFFEQEEIDAWLASDSGKTELQMISDAQTYAAHAAAGIPLPKKGGRR